MKIMFLTVAAFVAGAKLMNDIKDIEVARVAKERAHETFNAAYDIGIAEGRRQACLPMPN